MLLTIAIGNLTTVIGGYEDENLCFTGRFSSDRDRTEDEYYLLIRDILGMYQVLPEQVEGGIISSVVPPLRNVVRRAVQRLTGKKILLVGSGLKTGLNIKIDDPGELGGGLVGNAVGALGNFTPPIVIFDLETTTTMSVIDKSGAYVGGAIIPGLRVSVDAMSASAAQLPYITLSRPTKVINSSTVSCMQAGAVYSCAALIDGMADRVEEELGSAATVVLTGGISALIGPYCKREVCIYEHLQLAGLRLIYEKNQKKTKKS